MKYRCPKCGSEVPALIRAGSVTPNTNEFADEWVIDPDTLATCDTCLCSTNLHRFYEEPTLYSVEHTHEDKGDGGSSFYVVKWYPGHKGTGPEEKDVVNSLGLDFEPDKGEEIIINTLGQVEDDIQEVTK